MYILHDDKKKIRAVSTSPFKAGSAVAIKVKKPKGMRFDEVVGKLYMGDKIVIKPIPKPISELRIAVVCNWNDQCGISTYAKFTTEAIDPKVQEVKIFSEYVKNLTDKDAPNVERCWSRGENLKGLARRIKDWNPDFIIVQHEYGIFPNACHFMKFMSMIDDFPYVVVMHSVYEHLDKAVYSSAAKNILVHTDKAKETLQKVGNTNRIFVVPHGSTQFEETEELWNILQNPYTLLQFGFGFRYKGVERALAAIAKLKEDDPDKYEDIFYLFLLSTNDHSKGVHDDYCDSLEKLAFDLGVSDNFCVLKKFNSEKMLTLYMRLFKLAVFPYVMVEDNSVYAASGAIRIAMGNGVPVVASDSHLFDDLEGIVPRPADEEELAKEIDAVFSDNEYRLSMIQKNMRFIQNSSWNKTADQYLSVYQQILS